MNPSILSRNTMKARVQYTVYYVYVTGVERDGKRKKKRDREIQIQSMEMLL